MLSASFRVRKHRVSATGRPFIAVLRRIPGGARKTSKVSFSARQNSSISFFVPPHYHNAKTIATYFMRWPRRRSAFVMYGGSTSFCRSCVTNNMLKANSLLLGVRSFPMLQNRGKCSSSGVQVHQQDYIPYATLGSSGTAIEQSGSPPKPLKPFNTAMLAKKFQRHEPITMVTAYDCGGGYFATCADIDMVLCGDSLGMVVCGESGTVNVSMDAMVHHCNAAANGIHAAASSGTGRAPLLVGDLPFGSYLTPEDTARNAVRLIKEGHADAVKLEGGKRVIPQVKALIDAGIVVVGHVGLTPQTAAAGGGFGVRGRSVDSAMALLEDAFALQEAGASAIVLEMVPHQLAAAITERLAVPTIGIGAGGSTSGQVQVMPDILGSLTPQPNVLKHAKLFAKPAPIGDIAVEALKSYRVEVERGTFPRPENGSSLTEKKLEALNDALKDFDTQHNLCVNFQNHTRSKHKDALNNNSLSTTANVNSVDELDPLQQRIIVIGGGAMGSLYAHLLSNGAQRILDRRIMETSIEKQETTLPLCILTRWLSHANAIQTTGSILVQENEGGSNAMENDVKVRPKILVGTNVEEVIAAFNSDTKSSSILNNDDHTADIVLVLTKSDQTSFAAKAAAELLSTSDSTGVAITLQNGFSNLATLESELGAERAMAGVTTVAAMVEGPGLIRRTDGGKGVTTLAPSSPQQAAAARVIEQLLNAADAHTEILPLTTHEDSHRMIDPDIALPPLQAMQWRKALINVAINPLTAILGVSNGVLASTCNSHSVDGNPFAELMDCVINEAIDVLDAVENEMAPSIMQAPRWTQSAAQHLARRQRLVDVVEQTAVRTATNRSSMLSDVLRKNAVPELDGIVGHIKREGKRLGIQTPLLGMLNAMVRAKVSMRESGATRSGKREMLTVRDVMTLRTKLRQLREDKVNKIDNRHKVGLVATMGALHEGHLALVNAAKAEGCDTVVATIFVNPTQFGPDEDFESYPRSESKDLHLLQNAGVDLVFIPSETSVASELFPEDYGVFVETTAGSQRGEGGARPGFFQGVATVVTKLLNIVQPNVTFFGQKDGQQCCVVEQLVRDLNVPTEIVRVPTVRADDGLALSSRNAYLKQSERVVAPSLHQALKEAKAFVLDCCNRTEKDSHVLVSAAEVQSVFERTLSEQEKHLKSKNEVGDEEIENSVLLEANYFSMASARSAAPLDEIDDSFLRTGHEIMLSAGVHTAVSETHLIDNVLIKI